MMLRPGIWAELGTRGDHIRDLQVRIFCRSTSGVFDETTQTRLRGWQIAHGLAPTGVVDDDTAKELGWT